MYAHHLSSPEYSYTSQDHYVWQQLMLQQTPIVEKYACEEYIVGLKKINFPTDQVPSLEYVSSKMRDYTGWGLKPVERIIECSDFFNLLSEKTFPAIQRLRSLDQLDFYQDESPDVFHEYFGHCPLLTNEDFATSMQLFGRLAKGHPERITHILDKIFWSTFEFGVVNSNIGLKVYGAGILPSSLELSRIVNHRQTGISIKPLDIFEGIEATLQGNINQKTIYSVCSLKKLYSLISTEIPKLIEKLYLEKTDHSICAYK